MIVRHVPRTQLEKIYFDASQTAVPEEDISTKLGVEQSKSISARRRNIRQPIVQPSNSGYVVKVPFLKPLQKIAIMPLITPSFGMLNYRVYLRG